ncbi:DUF805 domain-containing protein [Plantibacter sp. M259]|uniref:DUF805 domain-containing protein n=1 Tax=Plantibacter sp. M259 TaxID=2583822 RepID=UPI0011104FF4|nr:DUF805 domain-containing protein [Plantibacter sp. M259]
MSSDSSLGCASAPSGGRSAVKPPVPAAGVLPSPALPLPGATMSAAVGRFFRQYTTFSGRASRSEYWWTVLFLVLVWLIPTVLFGPGLAIAGIAAMQREPVVDDGSRLLSAALVIVGLLVAVTVLPSLAMLWRRLHDAGFPGPLFFLSAIPLIGCIVVFVLVLMPSRPSGRRFDRRR